MTDYAKMNQKLLAITGLAPHNTDEKDRHYISIAVDNDKMVSYMTKKKIDELVSKGHEYVNNLYGSTSVWNENLRQACCIMTKPGRLFKHLLPDAAPEEISAMVSKWYNEISIENGANEFNFELTDKIAHYYHKNQTFKSSGSLGSSCMAYDSCNEYIGFYSNYDVELLILKNSEDKISGRALIWKDVFFPYLDKHINFMDRIYISDDNDIARFLDYALKNGIVAKKQQSFRDKENFVYNDETFSDTIKIESTCSFDIPEMKYPYIDTMTYMNDDCTLCNSSSRKFYISCESTDGTCSESGGDICADCGDRFNSENEGIYVENVGVICDHCRDHYYYCEDCDSYVFEDYIVNIGDMYYCESCAERNFNKCEDCGDWIKPDDALTSDNGDIYCESCYLDRFSHCDNCDCEVENRDIEIFENENLCPDCFKEKEEERLEEERLEEERLEEERLEEERLEEERLEEERLERLVS